MQLRNLYSRALLSLPLSLACHLEARKQRERETKKEIDQGSERRQARCGAEWEEARLLEEGRNWGDDLPGERNPETPARARARARDLSCEDVALFVHDVPNVSLLLSFCAPLSSALVCAAPSPLSSRPLRCVPSRYSFVLPRLPSLVVLANATGDSTPRRDVTRTMISGRIFSSRFVDRYADTKRNFILCVSTSENF